jgi:hypothetical protein
MGRRTGQALSRLAASLLLGVVTAAFSVLPSSSTVGRGALSADSQTLYIPVVSGGASVGLLRFKRAPETP